ncbi:phosphatidate cytidylyltransferase [Vibrio alginolyticus]|uniref:phosphatidate cytidylyltransferase n=1 Tax=Vibrio alginolyticus TaxID=663 RepID=UPI001560C2D8|nr:phosphatidate cytidylyltransferase [Vibrio alginolyticus]MBY7710543.1 phosphatidate cytidylyltransferase [Vibrio alginolyticus]
MKKEVLSHEFYLRVRSWWWMLLVLTLFVMLPVFYMSLLIAFLAVMGCREIAKVCQLDIFTSMVLTSSIALPILLSYWSVELMLFIGSLSVIAITIYLFRSSSLLIPLVSLITLFALCLFSLILLLHYPNHELALNYMLYLIFATQFNDAIQYFIGKKFGKRPLCPNISPSKTLEGAIGGCIVVSLTSTVIALFITPFSLYAALVISVILTLFGVLGDICVSWFKRRVGVKDMGTLIPGHGGILDRIDSLLLATPVFLLIVDFPIFYR